MKRSIVTYATGAHEELLDVALPTYKVFAERHHYDLMVYRGDQIRSNLPASWHKMEALFGAFNENYDEVVLLDCDLIIVDFSEDFPTLTDGKLFSLVRHFENQSEVPNAGVWRLTKICQGLLHRMMSLEVFHNHGWWEQAALMTMMGYTVPPEGSLFSETKCRNVAKTKWYNACQFMRLCWNSHPNYRAEQPKIVHCSYPDMPRRLDVMRTLVKDPHYDYPRYDPESEKKTREKVGRIDATNSREGV